MRYINKHFNIYPPRKLLSMESIMWFQSRVFGGKFNIIQISYQESSRNYIKLFIFIIWKQLTLLKYENYFVLEGAAEYYRPTVENFAQSCKHGSVYEGFSLSESWRVCFGAWTAKESFLALWINDFPLAVEDKLWKLFFSAVSFLQRKSQRNPLRLNSVHSK